MPKYKILSSFHDLQLQKIHQVGDEVEFTKERAEFITKHLMPFGVPFIEEVKKTRQKKEVKGESEENSE